MEINESEMFDMGVRHGVVFIVSFTGVSMVRVMLTWNLITNGVTGSDD